MKDLTVANKIIAEIARENKNITPVTIDDLPLFQEFFKKEPYTYGNSWTYVTQGAYGIGPNNLGYKYYDGKNLSLVGIYPKLEQPDINVFYWVRPMGSTVLDVIIDFSGKLLVKESIPTYIKKIFKEQADYLIKNGFNDVNIFPWHQTSPSEDDSCPEIIYDKNKSLEELSKSHIHRSLRMLYKKMQETSEKYEIEILDRDFQKNAWKITETFFESERMKLKETNYSTKYDYYNLIFCNVVNNCVDKKIIFSHGVPVGYYITEIQNVDYTGGYALLSLRENFRFLSDYIVLTVLKSCKTRFLNVGGSEDQRIHDYKMKFFPVELKQMYWVTNFKK